MNSELLKTLSKVLSLPSASEKDWSELIKLAAELRHQNPESKLLHDQLMDHMVTLKQIEVEMAKNERLLQKSADQKLEMFQHVLAALNCSSNQPSS